MIAKPTNYDEVEVKDFEYTPFELGGHKLVIKTANVHTNDMTGSVSLKITVDADRTDKQAGYFQEQYDSDTRPDKKWNNGATKYVSLGDSESQVAQLKAFITAVENSNPSFTYNWDKLEDQLRGLKVGGVFALEEYNANDGTIKTATKLSQFRSVDKVDNIKTPKVAVLDGLNEKGYNKFKYVEYEEYMANKNKNSIEKSFGDLVSIDDFDLD